MSDQAQDAPPPAAAPVAQPPAPAVARQAVQTSYAAPSLVPAQYLDEMAAARKEAAELKAMLARRDAADAEAKGLLAQLQEKVALTEREKGELATQRRADKIRYEARQAAIVAGAIDPDDVVALTAAGLTVAEGGAVVTAGDVPQKVEDYIKAFLDKKPHLAKPRVAHGGGAQPFTGAAPGAAPPLDLSTAEGMTRYARMITYPRGQSPK